MKKTRENAIQYFGEEHVKKVEKETKSTGGRVVWSEDGTGYKVVGGEIAFGNYQAEEDRTKPLFTTKHYKAIAEKFAGLINSAKPSELEGIKYCAKAFAVEFSIDNQKFDAGRFITDINRMTSSTSRHIVSW